MLKLNIQKFAEPNGEGNAAPNANGGNNANQNGGNSSEPKTYTQEELDNIVNERTGRATKSALKSFFTQKGLSEDEANQAINAYLDNKKKNTPNVSELQNNLTSERSARLKAQLESKATIEAIKQGVDVKSIPYVLKMADFKDCADKDGNISAEKLTAAIKQVLDDIPALKAEVSQSGNGIQQIGGDGNSSGSQVKNTVPSKRWNRFNQ